MFGAGVSQQIKTNLSPLIDLRKQQVSSDLLFKILDPPTAGQSASDWLLAHKTSLNVVDPSMGVPFFVLIVASPEDVSFEFQYELDLYWAVGRLWLRDEAAYECYAHSVIDYENPQNKVPTARKMAAFAPDYGGQDNGAGKLLCDNLAAPLAAVLGKSGKFKMRSFIGAEATKDNLNGIFSGSDPDGTPALLFTGSHGLLKLPQVRTWLTSKARSFARIGFLRRNRNAITRPRICPRRPRCMAWSTSCWPVTALAGRRTTLTT